MRRGFITVVAYGLVAGCAPSSEGTHDAAVADLTALPLDVTGKYASRLTLDFTVDRGAGPQATKAQLLAMWGALQEAGSSTSVATTWQMCTLPVPGLGEVPTH